MPRNRPKQGYYKPRHPEKYKGRVDKIRYMSSWELSVNQFLDNNPNIIAWASEEIAIPYFKRLTGKVHKYYPDYWVKYTNRAGEVVSEIWEVKPEKEINPPRSTGKNKKTQLYEQMTWSVNTDKWKAAISWCKHHNLTFRLVNEKDIFK